MTLVRVFVKIICIPDAELLSETAGAPLHTYSKLYDVPVGFVAPSHPRKVYCFICGHRRVFVDRYRMICLVLYTYVIYDVRWNPMNFGSQGYRSRSTLAHKPFKPCGHATEYNLSPSLISHA